MQKITLGCDPEFFVRLAAKGEEKQETKKKSETIVPICGKLGGTKKEPRQIPNLKEGFAMQEDGAAVEFNIPPVYSPFEFTAAVAGTMETLSGILSQSGLEPSRTNNLYLKEEWLKEFPNLRAIGCDPDFNSYAGVNGNPPPRVANPATIGSIRGAGGHIHVGYPTDLCPPDVMARFMDLFVYAPMLAHDKQGLRRRWWGFAGIYRPKSYGIEYRTPSNFWIWDNSLCKEIACRTFALIESMMTNIIPWQAMYNQVIWTTLQMFMHMEDVPQVSALHKQTLAKHEVAAQAHARYVQLAQEYDRDRLDAAHAEMALPRRA